MEGPTHIQYHTVPSDEKVASAGRCKHRLLHYHEIPTWQQENEYLFSGYRATAESSWDCVLSSFRWHNETVNIISHIVGSILFAALPWHFYYNAYSDVANTRPLDLYLFIGYFIGVSICFACSAECHISWNHSPSVAAFGNQLDYLGIVLLMWTASLPSIYYGFICDPTVQKFHWTLTTALGAGCVFFTMHPRFCKPQFRTWRAAMYTGLGVSALFFVAHGILLHGLDVQSRRMALKWMLGMASFNLFGAAAYAVRMPERLFPYRFDFVGASHQIFHIMVIFAGITHYLGLIQALREVRAVGQDCTI